MLYPLSTLLIVYWSNIDARKVTNYKLVWKAVKFYQSVLNTTHLYTIIALRQIGENTKLTVTSTYYMIFYQQYNTECVLKHH